MLTTLRIKNLALVTDLTLELQPGLNVITGETGAGKSILIGALNLLLGQRADRDLIRAGADACSVEAIFEFKPGRAGLDSFLEQHGLEPGEGGELMLKRTFTITGTNRQFINGSPTTLATLAELGDGLVDLHGPHDHQSLLQPARQLALLDAFGGLTVQRRQFGDLLRRRDELVAEKADLIVDERTYAQQLDLLRFQVREITEAQLQPDEEAELAAAHQRAANSARLLELAQTALGALGESEDSALSQLAVVGRLLQELRRLDAAATSPGEIHEAAIGQLRELQRELSGYLERVDLDPARLAALEERLNLIHSLKRKYGPTLADVMATGDEARRKLESLESRDEQLARLNAELEKLDLGLTRTGKALTAGRMQASSQLGEAVARELAALGFKQSVFTVRLNAVGDPTPAGYDVGEFLFGPNPGEPPRPLRTIASSGEIARVMLALKTVQAGEDEVPVLVFDEVDANVGGETAHAVGQKMHQIARRHQVLCITHLAPVAAHGSHHLAVTKEVAGGRSETRVEVLSGKARTDELCRMLGGGPAAWKHAEELVTRAR